MGEDACVVALRTEVRRLTERCEELTEALRQAREEAFNSGWRPPRVIGLTPCEGDIVGLLLGREGGLCTYAQIMLALYSLRPDGDVPFEKIIPTFVCKARRKLKPWGIEITTVWGRGYFMPPDSQQRLRAMEGERAA